MSRRATTNKVIADIKQITSNLELKNYEGIAFRGQPSIDYQLVPSIARNQKYLDNEQQMISMASYRKPDEFLACRNHIELLSKLQHYGIPTRLLDATRNALVALYFACQPVTDKSYSNEGVVYIFKYDVSKSLDIESVLEDSEDGKEWSRNSARDFESPVFIESPLLLPRQNIQQGLYMLFFNDYSEKGTSNRISSLSNSSPFIVDRIIISPNGKKQILKELGNLGVSTSLLFPDNLDCFCEDLKRRFQ